MNQSTITSSSTDRFRAEHSIMISTFSAPVPVYIPSQSLPTISSDAASFHTFNDLPAEIREMIWKYTFDTRVVYVEPVRRKDYNQGWEVRGAVGVYFRSRSPIPPLLHVCQEARRIGACDYGKSFQVDDNSPYVWFNRQRDTLYIDWEFTWFAFSNQTPIALKSPIARQVKYLALATDGLKGRRMTSGGSYWEICQVLSRFPNLQELTITTKTARCHFSYELPSEGEPYRLNEEHLKSLSETKAQWVSNQNPNFNIPGKIEVKLMLELSERD